MSADAKAPRADCYSAGERGAMVYWQDLRAAWLGPLLNALTACGVSADHVTAASLACGLAFCPLWLWPGNPPWARPAALAAARAARRPGRAARAPPADGL